MKTTTILIEGKPFSFEDEIDDITYDTIRPITEQEAKELLETTKKLFDICGMRFFLAFGTLLGAVREHGLIEGDEDVDVYVDSEEELRKNLPFLYENGLKLCRFVENWYYSFRVDGGAFIDVYIHRPVDDKFWGRWYDYIERVIVPKRLVRNCEEIEFLGGMYFVPSKPERILKCWYGSTWKIPISNAHDSDGHTLYDWWMNNKLKICFRSSLSKVRGMVGLPKNLFAK